jgi:hypothetical protein
MDEWIEAERLPVEEADPKALLTKWANVAEDMALIPERNVRMRAVDGHFVVEVSAELYEVFR